MLENNKKEKIFLIRKNESEVDDILKKIGIDIYLKFGKTIKKG